MGLEEDRLDMGGRMLHPKPSIQLLSVLMLLQNDMDAAKFKVFLKEFLPWWKGNLMNCNLCVYQMRLPDSGRVVIAVKIPTFGN